jgi:O-antigen ligase
MFATPAILSLLFFVYVRPQELVPGLERVPLLYLLVGVALVALALDVRLGYVRLKNNPLLPWTLAHMAWCLLSMAVFARWALITQGIALSVAFILFTVLSQGAQTFRALATVGVGMLSLSLFVALVGFHQGFAELGCVRQDEVHEDLMIPIGAACKTTEQCRQEQEREDLFCERVGVLGTTTVGGRVRFRGLMQDPNELALVSTLAVPFAFALFELRRTPFRLGLSGLTFLLVGAVAFMTRSRSGQMAFAAMTGVYLLRKLRWLGLGLMVLAAVPLALLGGRSTSEAEESADLRLGYWAAAIQMARESPLLGVGMAQFLDHQPQTAHSSMMLILAETGVPGLLFWTALMYAAFKTTVTIMRREQTPEAHPARVWSSALLACLTGFSVSAMFLSLTYHYLLWILLGLVGALYLATRRHDERLRIRFGLLDLAAVVAIDVVFVLATHIYTRSQGF